MALGRVRPVCIDLVLIFAIWSILIGTMLVLQGMGLDFGFQIWPFGEFRNWIELFYRMARVSAQQSFFGCWTTATACLLGGTSQRGH
jgi:hypothetical protein